MWPINDVAETTGVTSRTLRHYDAVGLLPPAEVDESGRRYYGEDELVRLQQIRIMRELGLGLEQIGRILAGEHGRIAALRRHRQWLIAEQDRLGALADSVSQTIADLEGGFMATRERLEQWFSASLRDTEQYRQYEQEAVDRWGQAAVDARERQRAKSDEQVEHDKNDSVEVHARIADLAAAGVPADDERTLEAVGAHLAWIRHYWEPTSEAFRCLGQTYADPNDGFRVGYENVQPGLADYLRDAIGAYADQRM